MANSIKGSAFELLNEKKTYIHIDHTESYYSKLRELHKLITAQFPADHLHFSYVTLCHATLEYSLNQLLIDYSLNKYGPKNYKTFAETLIKAATGIKLKLYPLIITEGQFKVREDHEDIQRLLRLGPLRNKLLHKKDFLIEVPYVDVKNLEKGTEIEFEDTRQIDLITKEECISFGESLGQFKEKIFNNLINREETVSNDILIS